VPAGLNEKRPPSNEILLRSCASSESSVSFRRAEPIVHRHADSKPSTRRRVKSESLCRPQFNYPSIRVRRWFPILWLFVILGATMIPLEPTGGAPPFLCVLCGDEALADAVLNATLFLPLGVALSAAGWRPLRAVVSGALLSVAVETAQFVIPGRDPSLSDVLFNTLGVVLGVALARSTSTWWRPRARIADVLGILGSIGAACFIILTGVLLGVSFPEDPYYGGWTPRFGHLEWYGGRVLQASLDGLEIPPRALANSPRIREMLRSGAPIQVHALAGPQPSGLAPLFTIHDGHHSEIVLLGVDGDDIVFRYRRRAGDWGLVEPDIRIRGALRGVAWRDPLSIVVRRAASGYCVRVNAMERCGLGYTIGTGWALLLGGQPISLRLQPALSVIWLGALFFPIGLWARLGWAFVIRVALSLACLLILPSFIDLLPTPGAEIAGAIGGLLAGYACRVKERGEPTWVHANDHF
jgi:VanZ like family